MPLIFILPFLFSWNTHNNLVPPMKSEKLDDIDGLLAGRSAEVDNKIDKDLSNSGISFASVSTMRPFVKENTNIKNSKYHLFTFETFKTESFKPEGIRKFTYPFRVINISNIPSGKAVGFLSSSGLKSGF